MIEKTLGMCYDLCRLGGCMMKHEMYDYDFGKFEKNDETDIDSSRLASSKPANMDIFNKFEELDDLITDEDLKFEDTLIANYQDLIDEVKAKKGIVDSEEEPFDEMENTQEITTFSDDVLEKIDEALAEVIEEPQTEEKKEPVAESEVSEIEEPKKKPVSLEASFISCSILGFIVLFFGYGMFMYIMTHM